MPRRERVASVLLLCGLAVTTVWLLKGTGRDGKSAAGGGTGPPYRLPAGSTLTAGWEFYPASRLYEKIDGRAALFEEYGVVELRSAFVSFGSHNFEVYAYLMGTPDGAMGVYLREAPQESEELNLGTLADASGAMVRVCHGKIYLVILPVEKESDQALAVELARSILTDIEGGGATGLVKLLPLAGRVPGSLALNRESGYGLKSLHDTVTATYRIGQAEFDYILRRFEPGGGEEVFTQLKKEIEEFGGETLHAGPGKLAARFSGSVLLVARHGDMLAGVYGRLSESEAGNMLEALQSHLGGTK